MRLCSISLLLVSACSVLLGQGNDGEIRFFVHDATGRALAASVTLRSSSNSVNKTLQTAEDGRTNFEHLPYGTYRYIVARNEFVTQTGMVDIHSPLPAKLSIGLELGSVETTVTVEEKDTLLDSHEIGSEVGIGKQRITERDRTSAGRSLSDLVASAPGWLLEANGVLHPRGSEYQVQYVVDGLPVQDNRSPTYAPPFNSDDVQSMRILTGSYPAEFGRKLGGVISVTTNPDSRKGWHGSAIFGGGSFGTEYGNASAQYGSGSDLFGISAEGERTDRYLDPPVIENYTNSATTASFSGHYQHDFNASDRLSVGYGHNQARFEVPNELVQQEAEQRQDREAHDNELRAHFQHILSPSVLFRAEGLFENVSATFYSNGLSTPIAPFQDRGFKQGYGSAAFAGQTGNHDWKAGGDFLYSSIRESFAYNITDPSFFDSDTPLRFAFRDHASDREGSAFAQDTYRFHNLNVSAGLRWDAYHLLVKENAWSPRLGASYYWPWAKLLVHASYDRAFQTPAIENLLLASSPALNALNDQVLRLPVRPSRGNFYEVGFSRVLGGHLRLNANWFRRNLRDFADDDVLLNTGVSFPVAFSRARIAGTEVRLEMPRWGRVSAVISYSNQAGTGFLPVTGGLFLGGETAVSIGSQSSFPITQDQRNTAFARLRVQATNRVWLASSSSYGSGLPAELGGADLGDLEALYSAKVLSRVNLSRNRVRPSFSLNFSGGAVIWKRESRLATIQADLYNATDRLNIINFASLFSGTAIAAPRSASARLSFTF